MVAWSAIRQAVGIPRIIQNALKMNAEQSMVKNGEYCVPKIRDVFAAITKLCNQMVD